MEQKKSLWHELAGVVLDIVKKKVPEWYSEAKQVSQDSDKQYEIARNLVIGATTAPVGGATKLMIGPHPVYQGKSSMVPHAVDIYEGLGRMTKKVATKGPYSSLKKALDIIKNYLPMEAGQRAFPSPLK